MNLIDWILLLVIALSVVLAVRRILLNHKSGRGCSGCCGSGCAGCAGCGRATLPGGEKRRRP